MKPIKIEKRPTKSLHFDHLNPRLAEFGITSRTSEDEILTTLWEIMDVRELVQSIAASGFFQHEPLIVANERGRDIVIEGNRRLAAVKALLNHPLAKERGWEVPQLTNAAQSELEELPVIVLNRKKAWRYLGFKHVNGAAKWSSFAKATYIAEVHDDFGESLATIAEQIGDRHNTVQRLYRGLMVIEQAERLKVFDRSNRYNSKFAFSHIYTGLDYDGISNYIALKSEAAEEKNPVPANRKTELGELLLWLYGDRRENKAPVVESQNPHLRQLNSALKKKESVAALRAGASISVAFDLSRPTDVVFEEAVLASKRELGKAHSTCSEGYKGSQEIFNVAESIVIMASDLVASMERKRRSRSGNRSNARGDD